MNSLELRLARIKLGLKRYQIAAAVGIAPGRLSEIETGRRVVDAELLARISKAIEQAHSLRSHLCDRKETYGQA